METKTEIQGSGKNTNALHSIPLTARSALLKGKWSTKLSAIIMGFSNLLHGQVMKGLLFLALQVVYIFYMIKKGIEDLKLLPSLGWIEMEEVWNEAKQHYEYQDGHKSILILLWGIVAICLTIAFIMVWRATLKSAYKVELEKKHGKKINNFQEDVRNLFDKDIHKLLLTPPILGILIFTILPLIFMIAMAFTDYSKINDKLVLFDWVGLKNFSEVLNPSGQMGDVFWKVLGWTVIWAIFATFLNFILGLGLTLLINRKRTRAKTFWRVMFSLTIAIPQFISLLAIRTMLNQEGAFNVLFRDLGLIGQSASLPFLTNPTWARVTVIIVNLWVGIPYTLLQVTGILQNMPVEFEEAAKIDGASPLQIFSKIKLPYILFVTTPYLITQFTGNINNFNVIYLLSGGGPGRPNSTAGFTDLLVTWLYKLTIDQQYFNIGAVIGIFTFITLSVIALITYRSSGSYKDEEAFQ